MDFDFSEDFAKCLGQPSPLQKLRQEWTCRRHRSAALGSPDASEPRPQELFPSPTRIVQLNHCQHVPPSPLHSAEPPLEDAFVASNASVRQREYEKLEMWIASGGSVDDFAPWFREMLMDHDDAALVSALRAVAAHYRRQAQQGALGDHVAPVPICWLSVLAERLMRCENSGPVTQEVAALVAACLAAFQGRSSDFSRHQAFLDRFATLPRGKVHLLAACEGVLQPEDWQEMWSVVQRLPRELLPSEAWHKLPQGLRILAQEELCKVPTDLASPVRSSPVLGVATPKTWRQRVRCLEHLTPQGSKPGDVQNLWPQLVLQVEDDHPAVSAAALQCLGRLAPQMPAPAEHLVLRLASALRQRLREPRCRPRRAALELLRCLSGCGTVPTTSVLLAQSLGVSKERARKALEADRSSKPPSDVPSGFEALLLEAFPRTGSGTPGSSPSRRKPSATPSPVTPATAVPSRASGTPEMEEKPSTPRKVLELETLRGSGPLTPLPSNSTLLSFEATPDKEMKLATEEDDATHTLQPLREDNGADCEASSADDHGHGHECHGDGSGEEVVPTEADTSRRSSGTRSPLGNDAALMQADHDELVWSFQKIHMITLDFSRHGVDEVELWQKLSQLLSRSAFQGPLQRFLERWRQRQRRRAAGKENLAPKSGTRLDDYASLRELCSDEDLPGAFPQSVLSHLRRTLTTGRPVRVAVVQAAVQALEKCAIACGRFLRPAWRRFAAPLLRLSAARRALRRGSAGALLRGAAELRNAWRTWMEVCQTSAGADQALLAESLQLVAMLEELPRFEIPSEVLQDILAVACAHLEADRGSRVAVASQRCLQSFRTLLGAARLIEEVAQVAPKLNLDVLEATGSLDPATTVAASVPQRLRQRNNVAEEARCTGLPAEVKTAPPKIQSPSKMVAGETTMGELEIFEVKILDVPTVRNLSSKSTGALRRMWQDLAARFAPKAMARLLLAAASSVRLCIEAAAEEDATAVSSLKAAHEVLQALQSSCDELLVAGDTADLFHELLQILLQLEIVSASEVLRQWTKPILLEVPPLFARAMDVIQAEQQLIAWLEVALKLVGPETWRGGPYPSAAKKTWALRFCARAAERCISALEGDEQLAWEALTKVTQMSASHDFAEPGSEWPGILQALRAKISEMYPCQVRDFLELAGALDSRSGEQKATPEGQ